MDAQVGAPELQHSTSVVPALPRVILLADQNDDVAPRHRSGGFESGGEPLLGAPPVEEKRVEDSHASLLEERCHHANGVAEVVERRRICYLAAKDETVLRRRCCIEQGRVSLPKLLTEVAIET